MDRFAFFSAQPWLFPPPERSVPPRGEQSAADGAVTVVVDGVPRRLPRHLALRPDLGGAPVDPPARGGVAHHPINADPAVVFDGCASVHFSEREQYGTPPAGTRLVSDEAKNRDCGHPSPRDARETPVVGAAAADAVHMAFAPHDEWPDQAQFACSIRVRRAVVEREGARGNPVGDERRPSFRDERSENDASGGRSRGDVFGSAPDDENDVFSAAAAACWLEMTVDGATHALDMRQSRHVVVGPPALDDALVATPKEHPTPNPTQSSRFERARRGRRDERRRRRRDEIEKKPRRRRRGRDDPGNAADDDLTPLQSSADDDGDDRATNHRRDDDHRRSVDRRKKRTYERPPSLAGRLAEPLDGSSFSAERRRGRTDVANECAHSALDAAYDEGFVSPDAATPYVTIVFAHVSLNLYHHPGVLGCRRSSPANERARVEKVRDALVAARDAATVTTKRYLHANVFEPDEPDAPLRTSPDGFANDVFGSNETRGDAAAARRRGEDATVSPSFVKHLTHAANVAARACSTLPRLAARAACEAAAPEQTPRRDGLGRRAASLASAAARAAQVLAARRSCELRWALAVLDAKGESGDERGDVPERARELLDDARAYAALARDAR